LFYHFLDSFYRELHVEQAQQFPKKENEAVLTSKSISDILGFFEVEDIFQDE